MNNQQNTPSQLNNQQESMPDDILGDGDKSLVLKQPRYWARAITWSLMGITLFGVGWLAIAKTEEIVTVTGKLEPLGVVKEVQVPIGGVVEQILVEDGEKVKKGQIVLRLDTEATMERKNNIEKTIQYTGQQLDLKRVELARFLDVNQTTQDVLKKRIVLEKEILVRYKKLADEGASAELQYLTQKNKVQEVQGQLDETMVERLRQEAILQQDIRGLQSQLADLQSQLTELNVNIRYQAIKSPVDGVVFDLQPKATGFVAQTSEPVMKIVPFDKLEARVEVPSKDIGFVAVGKPVDISIDSFPASDFGVLEGSVRSIGSDALPPDQNNNSYRYPADIQLNSQQLKIKDGSDLPLQVGMSLTANIKLRKVSYLQLLLQQFKDKTESLQRL
ncbi:HlyD family secretion protein [Synechococcus sp. BMK-MC-1]|uniref:HlyD family secretion protein n=1 Tax=Synechococcus sp. BMK-MC-1 TaxID=1442551 RepID=UPI0016481568|nr:HlyD family efflux transporter periplasmic adaptor subunit [Synechococcus sp. BMK-MC-1]QNI66239.1 type I secretion system ABC transporter/ HlyD family [Synechococcus sp. BMK-MC-1]